MNEESHAKLGSMMIETGAVDAHSAPTFLLDPIAARQFIDRGGFNTKEKLIHWVYENALMPAGDYWDRQLLTSVGRRKSYLRAEQMCVDR